LEVVSSDAGLTSILTYDVVMHTAHDDVHVYSTFNSSHSVS